MQRLHIASLLAKVHAMYSRRRWWWKALPRWVRRVLLTGLLGLLIWQVWTAPVVQRWVERSQERGAVLP